MNQKYADQQKPMGISEERQRHQEGNDYIRRFRRLSTCLEDGLRYAKTMEAHTLEREDLDYLSENRAKELLHKAIVHMQNVRATSEVLWLIAYPMESVDAFLDNLRKELVEGEK